MAQAHGLGDGAGGFPGGQVREELGGEVGADVGAEAGVFGGVVGVRWEGELGEEGLSEGRGLGAHFVSWMGINVEGGGRSLRAGGRA